MGTGCSLTLRVVVDTDVLVSAFSADGKPRRLVGHLLSTGQLVWSSQMYAELTEALWHEFIWKQKSLAEHSKISSFLRTLYNGAIKASVKPPVMVLQKRLEKDPRDDTVLGTAIAGDASYVVSEDRRLFDLGKLEGVRVMTVEEMLRLLN